MYDNFLQFISYLTRSFFICISIISKLIKLNLFSWKRISRIIDRKSFIKVKINSKYLGETNRRLLRGYVEI